MTKPLRIPRSKATPGRWLAALAVAVVMGWMGLNPDSARQFTGDAVTPNNTSTSLQSLYANRQSGIWTGIQGTVKRTLADDNEGSRHQRFIVQDSDGSTVLVAHNNDLAERVPLVAGDNVELYGRYEWNDKGGVLHWTHHDPNGTEPGGWIEYRGKRYR